MNFELIILDVLIVIYFLVVLYFIVQHRRIKNEFKKYQKDIKGYSK